MDKGYVNGKMEVMFVKDKLSRFQYLWGGKSICKKDKSIDN